LTQGFDNYGQCRRRIAAGVVQVVSGEGLRPVIQNRDEAPCGDVLAEDLVGSVDLALRLFASPQEFLASKRPDVPGCLVLDVRLPGMGGLTFQQQLAKMGVDLPIIFITGHGDIRMSVRVLVAELRTRYGTLTARERQIMSLVAVGRANKQIAAELDLSEMTVKVHRGQVMRKMQSGSLPELVRMADQLAVPASNQNYTASLRSAWEPQPPSRASTICTTT